MEELINRVRMALGMGMTMSEIATHFGDEDPDLLFLAYHAAVILVSDENDAASEEP